MKHLNSMARRFHAGFAVAVILAVLGACEGGSLDESLDESPQSPKIGYNEGDMVTVTVKVKTPQQSQSARSLNPGAVQFFANSYEVIFRKIKAGAEAADKYYRGSGTGTQGYISVAVPVGGPYEVLLLAGIEHVLVGAAYKGSKNAPGDEVTIKAGVVNEITLAVASLPPQWNTEGEPNNAISATNDFEFAMTLSNAVDFTVEKYPRRIQVGSPLGLENYIDNDDTFVVKFQLSKFTPLILADVATTATEEKLTLSAAPKIVLWPHHINDGFTQMILTQDPSTGFIGAPVDNVYSLKDGDDYLPLVYSTPLDTLPKEEEDSNAANPTGKKPRNIDTVLEFDLKYRAFGADVTASGGKTWTIRNGLTKAADTATDEDDVAGNAGAGSYIPVVFGSGTPGSKKGTETKIEIQ
ncbi:MAG: hypothetical protein LBD58_01800 [Treponema sp.]|nr:hypothetical protein [Treponema sp.]